MKKQPPDPKETKPEPPYLAVWFEVNKIGDSVKKKTQHDPKAYVRTPKVYYFSIGETPDEAFKEIYDTFGERPSFVRGPHQFAVIHGYKVVLPDSIKSSVLPIK